MSPKTPSPQTASPARSSRHDDCLDVETLHQIAAAADAAAGAPSERAALELVTTAAAELLDGVEASSITVRQPSGRFETLASSADAASRADRMQYVARTGPAVEAIDQHDPVVTNDLPADERYRKIADEAVEVGARSVLSVRLSIADDVRAHALNLYSTRPHAFDERQLLAAWQFGSQSAVAVRTARAAELVGNLQRALQSNRDIGVAVGVLMARRNIRRDDAYGLLRSASQHTQRKLAEIAADVAETGTLDVLDEPTN